MTIRHLKIFIAVVEYRTMHQAAKQLFVSQPSISQAITELESYYGVKLFERISQRLYLTEKGKNLLPHAQHVVDAFQKLEEIMKNSGEKSKIRIGASVTVGACILNDYVKKLEEMIPGIEVEVVVNNTSFIEDMLRNCAIDVAVVEGIIMGTDIVKVPLFEDELVIICGKDHPFYKREGLEIADLQNQPFISREEGSVDRNQFENILKQNNVTIRRKWICSNVDTIKNAVLNGRGLAIVSQLMIEKELQDRTLKSIPIHNVNLKRNIQLIYHKDKYLSLELKQFIEVCQTN
ncbi:LysR family transcriptional regulator [Anaerotignum sp.]|uniref:LysR family transcriptional regulator n=1 Tax=Anaerotignum sp. TaxID=2039241 RepID=UPI003332173F